MSVLREATVGISIRKRLVILTVISLVLLPQFSTNLIVPSGSEGVQYSVPAEGGLMKFLLELPSEGLYEGVDVVSDLKEWVMDQQKSAVSHLREMGIQGSRISPPRDGHTGP